MEGVQENQQYTIIYMRTNTVKDAAIFTGVTTDEKFLEAQVRQELKWEKWELDQQKKEAEQKLKDFEEKVKIEKARKVFISKDQFLLREQMDRMENLIANINACMEERDANSLAQALKSELHALRGMNIYISSCNHKANHEKSVHIDILYDYGKHGVDIYRKIKDNNVSYERTNEELGKIEVRTANWLQFSGRKPRKRFTGDN